MPIDLTSVYKKVNDVKRNLFYAENTTLKLFELGKVILELTDGWYIRKNPSTNLALGAEYFECSIASTDESIDLELYIPRASKVVVGKDQFTIAQYFRPREVTKQWRLRLESSGKYKHGGE